MKIIRNVDDLAINGAEPAFAGQLHVGRPFVGDQELFFKYAKQVLDSKLLTNNGPLVQEFERQVADYHDVEHCVATCNGTIALEMAIKALELKGEIIVPSFTFPATAHAVLWQAIKPIFADIDPNTHNLDPASVEQMLTEQTTGILGVHLWGRIAPVEQLQEIADKYDLKLLFDSAHAFGCTHNGIKVGNFGVCEILSFHATKFFNSFEGGAILTNDAVLADKLRLMRNFGIAGADMVIHPGTNGKMHEMSAAMGLTNLQSVDRRIEHNRSVYDSYRQGLANVPHLKLLEYDKKENNNYQYIVIELAKDCAISRDRMIEGLQSENVMARRYFWPGCHRMKPFVEEAGGSMPPLKYSESVSERVIVLPASSSVDEEEIDVICSIISALIRSA